MGEVSAGRATGLHRGLWVGTALFLLGLALGATGTAVLSSQSVRPVVEQAGGTADVDPGPAPTRAGVLVTNGCLRAVNDAQDALVAIDDAAQAAAELNAAALDEVVRRLQPVQDRLQANLDGCQVVTQDPGEDPTASSDAPLPELSPTEGTTTTTPSPSQAPSSPSAP